MHAVWNSARTEFLYWEYFCMVATALYEIIKSYKELWNENLGNRKRKILVRTFTSIYVNSKCRYTTYTSWREEKRCLPHFHLPKLHLHTLSSLTSPIAALSLHACSNCNLHVEETKASIMLVTKTSFVPDARILASYNFWLLRTLHTHPGFKTCQGSLNTALLGTILTASSSSLLTK